MSLHDHASIKITIEMPDFVCLCRQFQTRLSHLLCQAASTAGVATSIRCNGCYPSSDNRILAAARLEAILLCPLRGQLRAGTCTDRFSELLCCTPLSCHGATAANQLQMHGAASHLPATATALSVSSWLVGLNVACSSKPVTVCYIGVLYHTFQWFSNILYIMLYRVTKGHIAC